ncbi:MAG: hypothetical protein HYW14_02360 [Planctomycetes bacterium]|nr:hypothetical protein [Planctomycetota bacterium]
MYIYSLSLSLSLERVGLFVFLKPIFVGARSPRPVCLRWITHFPTKGWDKPCPYVTNFSRFQQVSYLPSAYPSPQRGERIHTPFPLFLEGRKEGFTLHQEGTHTYKFPSIKRGLRGVSMQRT